MSHTSTVKTAIKSVSSIRSAVAELVRAGVNVELKTNARPRMFFDTQHPEKSAFVLHLPNSPYDVGIDKKADGTYELAFDAGGGHIQRLLGDTRCKDAGLAPVAKFLQTYNKHVALAAAASKGYSVSNTVVNPQTGEVSLVLNVR